MTTTPEEQSSLEEEKNLLAGIVESLITQRQNAYRKLQTENVRARELTSSIVGTRRDEDKALLASDEAVSHGIKDQKKEEIDILHKQIEKPYFARIVLEEELESGDTKNIEYKLGFSANPDCRIIDWRKAPISKLYYEYKEGDDYSEEILGRERVGKVSLRNRVEIEKSVLTGVSNRFGNFKWNEKSAEWEKIGSTNRAEKKSTHALPEILSLISAEQFKAITEDAESAVLIQGVAGSGKTTVALHRLSWLLHPDNSPLEAKESVFLVVSPTLKAYVENSMPGVSITGVKVRTYHEWAARTLQWIHTDPAFTLSRPAIAASHGVERVKRSMALLKAIEAYVGRQAEKHFHASFADLQSDLLTILSHPQWIIDEDETHLIDRDVIQKTYEATKNNFKESLFDWSDYAILLRLYQLKVGSVVTENSSLGKYKHIVVDEVQDLSPVELATIIDAVSHLKDLTIVGDTSQNLDTSQSFPGWEKLQKHWNFKESVSKYLTLKINFRSTLPIMKLAEHVQGRDSVTEGRAGRVPIWFSCQNESLAIETTLQWLNKAIQLYPNMLTAVVCSDPNEAKFIYKMLQPTFGATVRLGDQYSFSFEEGIIVTDVRQIKGLEFFSVLIWNPSERNYPNTDLGKNLLYVAITRAEENLAIVSWQKPTPHLPQFNSALVRGIRKRIEEE